MAELVSTTGSQMANLALPWFVLTTTGSAKQMSFVVAARAAGFAVFGLPSGLTLARLGARRSMLIADATRAPVVTAIPILSFSGLLSFPALLALSFTSAALGAPYIAAQRLLLPELYGERQERVAHANAFLQGATRTTMVAGPALAGALIGIIGARPVLLIDAGTYAVAFVVVSSLVPAAQNRLNVVRRDVLRGVRALAGDRLLRLWALAFTFGDAAFSVIFLSIPVLVVDRYGGRSEIAGAIFAAWGLGAVVGNALVLMGRRRLTGLRVVAAASVVQALPLWLLAIRAPPALPVLAMTTSGISNGITNPTLHTFFSMRPPLDVRPHVMTASITASTVVAVAALLLAGPALSAVGPANVFAAAAAVQTVTTALVAASAWAERSRPTGKEPRSGEDVVWPQ